jgi:hypothetical protein
LENFVKLKSSYPFLQLPKRYPYREPQFSTRNLLKHQDLLKVQAWTGAEGFRRLRLAGFQEYQHMNVVRFSALPTDSHFS